MLLKKSAPSNLSAVFSVSPSDFVVSGKYNKPQMNADERRLKLIADTLWGVAINE